jgi:hypothetical protein
MIDVHQLTFISSYFHLCFIPIDADGSHMLNITNQKHLFHIDI